MAVKRARKVERSKANRARFAPAPAAGARELSEFVDGNRGSRAITDAAASGLAVSLREFGDLSGIVVNAIGGTLELIAGHQRLARLRAAGATAWTLETMPADGGDGVGYVEHPETGARFPVRIVAWNAERAALARYGANNPHIAGEFTALAVADLAKLVSLPEFAPLELPMLAGDIEASAVEPDAWGSLTREPSDVKRPAVFVLHVEIPQAEVVERAIARICDGTLKTRADALVAICRAFLGES